MAILAGWHIDDMSDAALDGLLDEGLDGVEVFTPHLSVDTQTFLLTLSKQEKLFVTAGSDYHGISGHPEELGKTGCPAKGLNTVRIFTRALSQAEPADTAGQPRTAARPVNSTDPGNTIQN